MSSILYNSLHTLPPGPEYDMNFIRKEWATITQMKFPDESASGLTFKDVRQVLALAHAFKHLLNPTEQAALSTMRNDLHTRIKSATRRGPMQIQMFQIAISAQS